MIYYHKYNVILRSILFAIGITIVFLVDQLVINSIKYCLIRPNVFFEIKSPVVTTT